MAIRPVADTPPASTAYERFRSQYPEFMSEIERLRSRRRELYTRLRNKSGRERHAYLRSLLRNQSLMALYAFEATIKAKRIGEATPASIRTLAERCNMFRRCDEEYEINYVRHASGRARRVVAFGPQRRAHQMFVADVLRILHPPLDNQYMFRGGVPAALRAVEAAYRNGFDHIAEVDFVRFYESVRPDRLADLLRPLPASVTNHVVWDRAIRRNADTPWHSHSGTMSSGLASPAPPSSGLVGLAAGSATSPVVGERIIGSIIFATRGVRMITYADNVLILGKSEEEVLSSIGHLRAQAERLGTGPLEPREASRHRPGDQSGFLHYRPQFDFLHHTAEIVDDEFTWSPDQRKLDQYRIADSACDFAIEDLDAAKDKISHWRRAYPTWRDGDEWELRRLTALDAARFYKLATPANLSLAAHRLALCYFTTGCHEDILELIPDGRNQGELHRRKRLVQAALERIEALCHRHNLDPAIFRARSAA